MELNTKSTVKGQTHLSTASLETKNGKWVWPALCAFFHYLLPTSCLLAILYPGTYTQMFLGNFLWIFVKINIYPYHPPISIWIILSLPQQKQDIYENIQVGERQGWGNTQGGSEFAVCWGKNYYQRSRKGSEIVCHRVTAGACWNQQGISQKYHSSDLHDTPHFCGLFLAGGYLSRGIQKKLLASFFPNLIFFSSFMPLMLKVILGLSVLCLASTSAVDWYSGDDLLEYLQMSGKNMTYLLLYLQHFSILL